MVRKYARRKKSKRPFRKVRKVVTYQGLNKYMRKRVEKKAYLNEYPASFSDWNGGVASLTDIAQGDTDTTRDGDALFLKSIYLRGMIRAGEEYNNSDLQVRFMIFQWFERGVSPTPSDILAGFGSLSNRLRIFAPYSHDNRFRFNVLYDKTFRVYNDDIVNGKLLPEPSMAYKPIHTMIKKIKKRYVQFIAGSTTGMNKLYFLNISNADPAASVTTKPSYEFLWRINFTDS